MAARNAEDRALISRIAAAERWGHEPNRPAATAPARAGLRAKFAREADPAGTLTAAADAGDTEAAAELERRIDSLMHAHMLRMTLAAKASRRKAAELTVVAERAEAELAEAGGHDDAA